MVSQPPERTNTNMQHKHKYIYTNIQIHTHKYTNTYTKIHKYKYTNTVAGPGSCKRCQTEEKSPPLLWNVTSSHI